MKNVKFASIFDQLINTVIIMDMMFNTEMIVKDMKGGKEDMTENKRFILEGTGFVYDNENLIRVKDIVKLMNALHEENQKLLTLSNIQKGALVKTIEDLTKENEELKHFQEKVFSMIEDELEEHPYLTLTEKWNPNCKNYHSCRGNHEKNVFYASRHTLLEKLREELSYD